MHRIVVLCAVAVPQLLTAQSTPEVPTPAPIAREAAPIRVPIRSITQLHGAIANTLETVGLVTGLNKTGSGDAATRRAMSNLIRRDGLNISPSDLTSGSVALVTVSAELPPFAHVGRRIDVRVHVVGDALSLEGGYLQNCELSYFDGAGKKVFVTASGPVSTGGFGAAGETATITQNFPTSGRVTRGGVVVEALKPDLLSEAGDLELILRSPSLGTAQNIARSIDRSLGDSGIDALVVDEAMVRIRLPENQRGDQDVLRVLGLVRDLEVAVEHPRKVLVHIGTGTIIAGAGVQISPCVVAMSDLTISVVSEEDVSQPAPGIRNAGTTERVVRTRIDVVNEPTAVSPLRGGGATVATLMENLKALQLSPRQLIEVFRNLDAGGYLHAPLEVR